MSRKVISSLVMPLLNVPSTPFPPVFSPSGRNPCATPLWCGQSGHLADPTPQTRKSTRGRYSGPRQVVNIAFAVIQVVFCLLKRGSQPAVSTACSASSAARSASVAASPAYFDRTYTMSNSLSTFRVTEIFVDSFNT